MLRPQSSRAFSVEIDLVLSGVKSVGYDIAYTCSFDVLIPSLCILRDSSDVATKLVEMANMPKDESSRGI